MIRENIKTLVLRAIEQLQQRQKLPEFEIPEIKIEHPEEKTHGDYATNIAMVLAGQINKNPLEVAKSLGPSILNLKTELFDKVEIAKPGFINFFLSKKYLQNQIGEILNQGKDFGKSNFGKNKKTNVEFISANPTGSLHIGNGRGAFFGDVLANVLEKAGFKVAREYFINDAQSSKQIQELGKTALGKGTIYLTKNLESKIKNLKSKLKKITDEGKAGRLLAQEVQKDIESFVKKKLKIKFDNWVSEEGLYKKNKIKKIFDWLKKKNLVYEKDRAYWIKTSQFGDEKDWVVIRETGEPTYLLSDTAHHKDKFNRGFKKIIDIWGADHQAHVSKIKAAAKILGFRGDLDILITQLVVLKGKEKISKRKGKIIFLKDLIDEIGLDVARFFYLQKSLDTHMEIDLNLAKEQSEKNPVFYVQYAYARICSILRKVSGFKFQASGLKLLNHSSELDLIKQLIGLPEIVEDTAKDYQVQRLPQYATGLATAFHRFYRDCRVLSENKELSQARLALILATKIVLKNALDLMGISAPEKM